MNWRPGPSVRDGPSPLPPVPIDSARPSAAWDTGSWQVAQAMSRLPLKTLSNMRAWPRSTSACGWAGVGAIGTTPHLPRLCRSSASSDAGGPDGVFHPSQPLASTSRPRYAVPTMRVIIVHLLSRDSAQRERDGELVRDHVNPIEGRRRPHRGKEASRPLIEHGVGELVRRCDQPIRPVRHAPAVAQLELRKPDTQAPRGRPFEPRLFHTPGGTIDEVSLGEVVVDGAHHETELQGGGLRERPHDFATDAQAEQRVREVEAIVDRPAAHRDRITPRVAVGVAASDQVLLQIGWYPTSTPNSDGPDVRETPTPSSYAAARPGSCGILRRSVVGALGCDVRLAVASHPMRHPDAVSGRSYLTCRPHRWVKSRLCSSLGRCKNC